MLFASHPLSLVSVCAVASPSLRFCSSSKRSVPRLGSFRLLPRDFVSSFNPPISNSSFVCPRLPPRDSVTRLCTIAGKAFEISVLACLLKFRTGPHFLTGLCSSALPFPVSCANVAAACFFPALTTGFTTLARTGVRFAAAFSLFFSKGFHLNGLPPQKEKGDAVCVSLALFLTLISRIPSRIVSLCQLFQFFISIPFSYLPPFTVNCPLDSFSRELCKAVCCPEKSPSVGR